MTIEDSRKQQFIDALKHMEIMMNNSVVKIQDVNYLIGVGSKLLMTFEDMEKSRAKWKSRAESAEAELKQ